MANILPAPVANRMYFIQVKPDYKEWVDNFAIPNNLRPEIISYIIERGSTELFESPLENTAWASPRSWTNLSKELDSFEKVNGKINDDEYDFIIRGSIGENKANQFLMFTLLFAKWDFNKLKNMGIEKAFAEIKE